MMWWQDDGWSAGWVFAMMLGWVALLALGTWAVVALTRGQSTTTTPSGPGKPREILDRRLAAGEITEAEYVRARQLMQAGPTTPTTPT